ncbi:Zn-ribbon domain-containing OB-fold protein [Halostagnicola bangensis]
MTGERGLETWLDAVETGDGYYLECPDGHASLPPRQGCPSCGENIDQRQLPSTGKLSSYTMTNVGATPFSDEVLILLGIAAFGPISVTGRLPNIKPETVTFGMTVTLEVERRGSSTDRLPVFCAKNGQ